MIKGIMNQGMLNVKQHSCLFIIILYVKQHNVFMTYIFLECTRAQWGYLSKLSQAQLDSSLRQTNLLQLVRVAGLAKVLTSAFPL
jgi:hypothetical protein